MSGYRFRIIHFLTPGHSNCNSLPFKLGRTKHGQARSLFLSFTSTHAAAATTRLALALNGSAALGAGGAMGIDENLFRNHLDIVSVTVFLLNLLRICAG